jgi:holo-[acyl-carrier protein] synthase
MTMSRTRAPEHCGPRLEAPVHVEVGVDVVDVHRLARLVERHGALLTERVFTPGELVDCGGKTQRLAARLAAKEAVAKALGTGIGPVAWRDVEVVRDSSGRPQLRLAGNARSLAADLGFTRWSVSLTHGRGTAVAVVAGLSR